MKKLPMVMLFAASVFGYGGGLHERYIEAVPEIFKAPTMTFTTQEIVSTVQAHMVMMQEGCKSPDRDNPELRIPDEWLPESLRKHNTSLAKWEHVLPDDVPDEIEAILKKFCKEFLNKEFEYADRALIRWYGHAKELWLSGDRDSALYILAR